MIKRLKVDAYIDQMVHRRSYTCKSIARQISFVIYFLWELTNKESRTMFALIEQETVKQQEEREKKQQPKQMRLR